MRNIIKRTENVVWGLMNTDARYSVFRHRLVMRLIWTIAGTFFFVGLAVGLLSAAILFMVTK